MMLTIFFSLQQSIPDISKSSSGLFSKRTSLDGNCLDSSQDTDSGLNLEFLASCHKSSRSNSPTFYEAQRIVCTDVPLTTTRELDSIDTDVHYQTSASLQKSRSNSPSMPEAHRKLSYQSRYVWDNGDSNII
ncbi:hypothetical protein AB205_0217500 [Aquarana catesbeiana]|uniref:Uncharacterized protein n=1 Tax=Aquarana catesbeiana TaxID=8400 RepID=A0A2G9SG47_AQUCT|nr:hypothetical protein AB205_0217500 [Aquarana catesbeiana]